MKTGSILVLFALVISVMIPNITITYAATDNQTMILTLDVCSPSGSAAASNADMPSLHECMCSLAPLTSTSFHIALNPVFNSFLIAFQKEYPPEV
jgi:hypothetical protein